MDYLKIINEEIKNNPDIIFDEHSTCFSRTHAHYKPYRICKYSPVNSYRSLMLLLHEIGHIRTGNQSSRSLSETTATKWAIERLKALGLPIKRRYTKPYKDYIAMTYRRGLRRGLKQRIKSKLYL